MKAILCFLGIGILLLLGSITVGVGQHVHPLFSAGVTDYVCNSIHDICHDWYLDDCEIFPFTGSFNGQAHLTVEVKCPPPGPYQGPCGGCFACSYVKRVSDGQIIASAATPFSPCNGACEGSPSYFQLQDQVDYELLVCKRSCDGNCDHCSRYCFAHAEVIPN